VKERHRGDSPDFNRNDYYPEDGFDEQSNLTSTTYDLTVSAKGGVA